jgi:hypothetical protein
VTYENQILDALLVVLANDLPEETLPEALADQARLLSGIDPDELGETILN